MEDEKKPLLCRVCIIKIEPSAKCFSLFQQYEDLLNPGVTFDVIIAEKITALAEVEISDGDGLPSKICMKCLLELEAAYEFKRKCENSDDILHLKWDDPEPEALIKKSLQTYEDDYLDYEALSPVELHGDEDIKPNPEEILTDKNTQNIHLDEADNLIQSDADKNKKIECNDEVILKLEVHKQTNTDSAVKKSKAVDLKLECDSCHKLFKSKCKMRVHWKKEHNKFICPTCKSVFRSIKAYKNHQTNRTKFCLNAHKFRIEGKAKTLMVFCNACSYKSNSKLSMLTHLAVHSKEKNYPCILCLKNFSQVASLQRHKEMVHKLFPEIRKTCHICGEIIVGQYKFSDHLTRKHSKRTKCTICNKEFSIRNLKNHMLIHSGIRSYSCNICFKTFVTAVQVNNHKRNLHQPKEIHTCKLCGYKSKDLYNFRKHEKMHNPGNIACGFCGYFVLNDKELKSHMKIHLNKPHKCNYCNKSFCLRKTLTQHYRDAHKFFVSKELKRSEYTRPKKSKPKHSVEHKVDESDASCSSECIL